MRTAAALGSLLCACARSTGLLAPLPTAVAPAAAYTANEVRIAIRGENFTPRAWREVGAGGAVHVDASFRAFLGSTELQDVRWEAIDLLTATVPPGFSGGPFDLRVVGPTGEGTLGAAFRALAAEPATVTATLSAPAAVEVGGQFGVEALLINAGDTPVGDVSLQLDLDPALTLVSGSSPPTQLEPRTSARVTWVLSATSRGPARIGLRASGTDAFLAALVESEAQAMLSALLPPTLSVTLGPPPATVSVGQRIELALDATNSGEVDLKGLAFAPLSQSGPGSFTLDPSPGAQDLPAGQTRTFRFGAVAALSGSVGLRASGTGTDLLASTSATVQGGWDPLVVQIPPQLAVRWLQVPGSVAPGDPFATTLAVINSGEATAAGVLPTPDPPTVIVTGGAVAGGGFSQAPADIPGGGSAIFNWTLVTGANAATGGTIQLETAAAGTDANSGATVTAQPLATSPTVVVQTLTASLSLPAAVLRGDFFSTSMRVGNSGASAMNRLTPAALTLGPASSASCGTPSPTSADLPPGGSVLFTWSCRASAAGTVQAQTGVSGTDAGSGVTRSASAIAVFNVVETLPIAADPFLDGTPIASVAGFAGSVYLGPRANGAGAVRLQPDGSGAQGIGFSLAADTSSGGNQNSARGPYPSFGHAGCRTDTLDCGPDNENGRAYFTSGSLNGVQWLLGAGSSTPGSESLTHFYASTSPGAAASFAFVDLHQMLSSDTRFASIITTIADKVYAGFGVINNGGPELIELPALPALPGLNAVDGVTAFDLSANRIPGIGSGNPAPVRMIDAIAALGSSIYLFNNGGCARSSGPDPAAGTSWTPCTPASSAYFAKTSTMTGTTTNLTPSDHAFQAVTFGGRLYAARNTCTGRRPCARGPQLWSCAPGTSGVCEMTNWSLVAPNGSGDPQLTQFDDPANTSITLLVATQTRLFVGFDSARGVLVMRSKGAALPAVASDFEQVGAAGLGVSATRIFDGKYLPFGGVDSVYAAVGDGTSPVRLVRVAN